MMGDLPPYTREQLQNVGPYRGSGLEDVHRIYMNTTAGQTTPEPSPEVDGVLYARFPASKLVETVSFGRCPKCGCFAKVPEHCGRCARKAGGKTLMEVLCPGKPDELV
jgi:hypothetical protein